MKSVYWAKKWKLFQEIEKLKPKSKERSILQNIFNTTMPQHEENQMYSEEEVLCQKCGGNRIGRIQADDEYYDICDDCGYEQYD